MVSSHVRRQAECGNLFPKSRSLHRSSLTPRKDRKYVIGERSEGLRPRRGARRYQNRLLRRNAKRLAPSNDRLDVIPFWGSLCLDFYWQIHWGFGQIVGGIFWKSRKDC